MRIRTIKPEFWQDKKVASWPCYTRLFFIALWSAADDYGRGSAEPARLAGSLFAYDLSIDPIETLNRISESLNRLARESKITLYRINDETYFEITNWKKHQKVVNPGKPWVPAPSDSLNTVSIDSIESLSLGSKDHRTKGPEDQGPLEGATVVASASNPESTDEPGSTEEPKAPKEPKPSELSDEEWLASLGADPAYEGISVPTEYAKMVRWCEVNKKQPTRRRFVNWLNRADRKISVPTQQTLPLLHRQEKAAREYPQEIPLKVTRFD
ncbi:MAG: hypothetical protein AB9869_17870 [Verrucomicrobiia bacterium]